MSKTLFCCEFLAEPGSRSIISSRLSDIVFFLVLLSLSLRTLGLDRSSAESQSQRSDLVRFDSVCHLGASDAGGAPVRSGLDLESRNFHACLVCTFQFSLSVFDQKGPFGSLHFACLIITMYFLHAFLSSQRSSPHLIIAQHGAFALAFLGTSQSLQIRKLVLIFDL